MEDKLQKAICNNNDLYEAILGSQDIKCHKTGSICYSLEKVHRFIQISLLFLENGNRMMFLRTLILITRRKIGENGQ